ncbi:MAG: hypothetical protein R3255_06630 [Candidatus Lokiarchaeia archaeon]|nr:hypothetical protein [Candidatus Lokiarchaeia archaeon]
MPRAIILYEIDPSFGPNVIAEYYLKHGDKLSPNILKDFSEGHDKKQLLEITKWEGDNRYFSKKITSESLEKENLYLSFILQEEEDLVSVKSLFTNVEEIISQNYTDDKNKMTQILNNAINSILSLMEKLKEPKIIKETINDRTKKMLDDGKLSEARELIDLGEEIPEKLAAEVKIAEDLLNQEFYRKAKKNFIKAAELAKLIQEEEIASFLLNKGEQVGLFPDLLKERETLYKEIEKILINLEVNQFQIYDNFAEPIERLIDISLTFEEHELVDMLTKLKNYTQRASKLAKELDSIDKNIRDLIKKI